MYLQKVIVKENLILMASCKLLTIKAGSGSVRQWYGSRIRTKMAGIPRTAVLAQLFCGFF
jgi:hypothetical protein